MNPAASQRSLLAALLFSLALASGAAAQQPATPEAPPTPPAPQADPTPPAQPNGSPAAEKPRASKVLVPAGTKLPLVLHNSITTRNAKRPGHVKGRGELRVRLNSMILPNGYTVNFNAVPTNAGTGGNESVEEEGKIKGDSDKAGDVGTVVKTTGIGAGIGSIAGRSAKGAGIGAGAGAAVGLATVLFTRGPELELPRGTTLDVVLDRNLYLDADKVQFTDPGRASTLAGPPNREPSRNRIPF